MGVRDDGTLTMADFSHLMDNGAYGFKTDVYFFCCDLWGGARETATTGCAASTRTSSRRDACGPWATSPWDWPSSVSPTCAPRRSTWIRWRFRVKNQIKSGQQLRMQEPRQHMKGVPDRLCRRPHGRTEVRVAGDVPSGRRFHPRTSRSRREEVPLEGKVEGLGRSHLGERHEAPRRRCRHRSPLLRRRVRRKHLLGRARQPRRQRQRASAPAGARDRAARRRWSRWRPKRWGCRSTRSASLREIPMSFPWASGSSASTTMFRTGWATREACRDAKRQLLGIAAKEFFDGVEADRPSTSTTESFTSPTIPPTTGACRSRR